MKFSKALYSMILGAIVAGGGLAACSSGSSSGGSSDNTGQGPEKVTSGVITGFGSVFVNGVEYNTDNATIKVDGDDTTEDKLALGMVVKVKGTVDPNGTTGHASSIEYNNEIRGIVMSVDLANGAGTIDVMGQTVNVDADTAFESHVADITSIDMLQAGNIVEVSGYTDGNGAIYATRIEVKQAAYAAGDVIEVKGMVSNLDTTAMTFSLGNLTVDYSSANLMNFPDSGIADGLFVEVTSTTDVMNNELTATQVTMINAENKHVTCKVGDDVELEGVVTTALDNNLFTLNDQQVMVNDSTEYVNGSSTDIVEGTKLEVGGQMDANGDLVASHIKFRMEPSANMYAPVDAVSTDTNTITVMGVEIHVTTLTHMLDLKGASTMTSLRYFSLSDIATTDWVDVHYYKDANGDYVATAIVRKDTLNDTVEKLEGTIDDVTQTGVMVAGVDVTVDPSLSTTTFTVGQKVEVKGTYADGTLTASFIALTD